MDPKTLTALQGSIQKWQNIVDGTGKDEGPENCPLCQLFYTPQTLYDCEGCPVREKTGKRYCEGSPYQAWSDNEDASKNTELALNELNFLKSLLP